MKRARRPSPVPPPAARVDAGGGDEPPFSEEELREAAALRDALARGEDPLAVALRAAWAPAPLDGDDLAAIVDRALGQGEAATTRSEREAAAALRDELEQRRGFREATAIFGDLKAAHDPGEIPKARNEELIDQALARAPAAPRLRLVGGSASRAAPAPRPRESTSARSRWTAKGTMAALSGVVALAAGVALLLGQLDRAAAPAASLSASALIHARSTDDLFDPAQKFEVGAQSARIDRIASARASDLRQNRFAAWGVR
jgi:hypothetical protein